MQHWTNPQLDVFLAAAYRHMVLEAEAANGDFFSALELINTDAAGTFAVNTLQSTFLRPITLTQKPSLAAPTGTPYDLVPPRANAAVLRERTATVRGGTLQVEPREVAPFAFEYVFQPTPWETIADGAEVGAFPVVFHSLIAIEGAILALSEAGKFAPLPLQQAAEGPRRNFQSFIGRHNVGGPTTVLITDPWGG